MSFKQRLINKAITIISQLTKHVNVFFSTYSILAIWLLLLRQRRVQFKPIKEKSSVSIRSDHVSDFCNERNPSFLLICFIHLNPLGPQDVLIEVSLFTGIFSILTFQLIAVGIKALWGTSRNELITKPISAWTPDDVYVWVGEQGPWARGTYDIKFRAAGIDGTLLTKMTEEDLEGPPINMELKLHRRVLLTGIKHLSLRGVKTPSDFWEYKVLFCGFLLVLST